MILFLNSALRILKEVFLIIFFLKLKRFKFKIFYIVVEVISYYFNYQLSEKLCEPFYDVFIKKN
jgi:hypothetical protein